MTLTEPLPVVEAVRRALEIDGRDGPDGRRTRITLTLTTNLAVPPARLWPLLADPAQRARWCDTVTGALAEGERLDGPGGAHGRVLGVQEPHRIELTWGGDGPQEPLRIRLDPEDDGTTALQLRRTLEREAQELETVGAGALALRWELAVLALAAHTDGWRDSCLQTPPVPTADWLRGAEGAAHVRAWSVRWAAAALAAGVEESVVRRGEQETVRRYGAG